MEVLPNIINCTATDFLGDKLIPCHAVVSILCGHKDKHTSYGQLFMFPFTMNLFCLNGRFIKVMLVLARDN